MKRISLLTATVFSVACLGISSLSTHAAPKDFEHFQLNNGNILIGYNSCNSQILQDILEDCFQNICYPGVFFPGFEQPDCNIPSDSPDIELPDAEFPGTDAPDVEIPDAEVPDVDAPDVEIPDAEVPDVDAPDVEVPDVDAPNTELPDVEAPDINLPDTEGPDIDDEIIEDSNTSPFIAEVVSLVNAERAKAGLAPLTINTQVQAAAQVRAKECEQSFSHTRPNGSSFSTALKEQNVSYRSAGENIAWGQRSPKEVMNAWMKSEGHRANIMNPNYTSIGVGYYQNANGTNYWCQLFIR